MIKAADFNQQRGIAHMGIILAVVVLSIVGFAGYRVVNNDDTQSNSETNSSDVNLASNLEDGGDTLDDAEEVDLENLNAAATTPIKGGGGPGDTPPARTIGFVKGGLNVDTASGTVFISNTASEELNGACKYQIFKQPEYNIEFELETQSSGKTCSVSFSIDKLYGGTGWDYQLVYENLTDNVVGHGGGYINTSFEFTKGGGNFDGENVIVSETSNESHTGVCEFTFTLPGSPTVTRTESITNSRTCTTSIPGSEFASSGNWLYDLKFTSTPELFVGTGGNFQILIQK